MKKIDIISDIAPDALFADGFDDAIIGLSAVFREGQHNTVVAYDKNKILESLKEEHGMDEEEAQEYFICNVADAYVGGATPIFIEFMWALAGPQEENEYVFN